MSMQNDDTGLEQQNKAVEQHDSSNARLYILGGVFVFLCLILVGGLGYRQLILNPKYEREEQVQSLRRVIQPGPRGNIYDRNGKLLVGNRPRFSVVAYLGELRGEFKRAYIKKVRECRHRGETVNRTQLQREARASVLQGYLDEINGILGRENEVSAKDLDKHFYQRLLLPMVLVNDLDYEEYARLVEQIPVHYPVQVSVDTARYYPYGPAAAHALGYVASSLDVPENGVPGEDLTTFSLKGKVGKAGIEKSFDDWLQGESGGEVWRVDPAGFQYELVDRKMPKQGNAVQTSLDVDLQITAENALGNMVGAIVALDVETGEVLAMASKPSYDLNQMTPFISQEVYNEVNDAGAWLNRVTQGLYPPGSPFKTLIGLALLRSGVVDTHTELECTGTIMIGDRAFPCHSHWKWQGHGMMDLSKALAKSCNPFFFKYAVDAGVEVLSGEAVRFGFAEPTGIELPYEAKYMIVPDREWKKKRGLGGWRGGDTANMCIGQGYLMVTPLQMACYTASLARKSTRTKPTICYVSDASQVQHGGEAIGLTDEQYDFLIGGMQKAVEEGTCRKMHIPGLPLAAKTGTSQVKIKNGSLDVVWCIAFAPIKNPKVAIAVAIEEQEGDNFHGGTTAAPVAKAVLREYFRDII